MHPTLLVSVQPWTETLLIPVLWRVGTTACHCSPTSEVTKYACSTPEWGHAGLCQHLPGTSHTWQVVAQECDVPLVSWGQQVTPQPPRGRSGFGGQMRGNLSTVWDADPTEMTVGPFI